MIAGIPPTWDFLKAVKDLAPKGHGVDCDLVCAVQGAGIVRSCATSMRLARVPVGQFLDCLEEKCEQDKVRTSDLDVLFKEFASGAGAGNVHGYKIRQLFAGVEVRRVRCLAASALHWCSWPMPCTCACNTGVRGDLTVMARLRLAPK
jgi:hypothetical protein